MVEAEAHAWSNSKQSDWTVPLGRTWVPAMAPGQTLKTGSGSKMRVTAGFSSRVMLFTSGESLAGSGRLWTLVSWWAQTLVLGLQWALTLCVAHSPFTVPKYRWFLLLATVESDNYPTHSKKWSTEYLCPRTPRGRAWRTRPQSFTEWPSSEMERRRSLGGDGWKTWC